MPDIPTSSSNKSARDDPASGAPAIERSNEEVERPVVGAQLGQASLVSRSEAPEAPGQGINWTSFFRTIDAVIKQGEAPKLARRAMKLDAERTHATPAEATQPVTDEPPPMLRPRYPVDPPPEYLDRKPRDPAHDWPMLVKMRQLLSATSHLSVEAVARDASSERGRTATVDRLTRWYKKVSWGTWEG